MTRPPSRLRLRLTLLGVLFVVVPLIAVLMVSAWTVEDVSIAADGSGTTHRGGLSVWVPVTVVLFLLPASAAAWWWAGREIRRNERLVASAALQQTLLEDASHQLRTPLAVLRASADVALADPRPSVGSLVESLRTVQETSAQMQQLVDGVLSDARRRHGAAHDVDLRAMLIRVCATHEVDATERGIRLDLRAEGGLPRAGVDPQAVERAVNALVDNAVRHSPEGGVVDVEAASTPAGVAIAVTDQGPGIPDAARREMFQRYWSAEGRTGIGLAVVAQVAEAYGHVDVQSPTGGGRGTRFTLHIDAAGPA